MKDVEVYIRLSQHSEGGISYDIWLDPEDKTPPNSRVSLDDIDSDDGGLCIDEASVERGDNFKAKDYEDALDMAKDQMSYLLKRDNA